jgi:two-component system, chemotaxis family, chemotaxis protein CheY
MGYGLNKLNIMLVEDDPSMRKLIRDILTAFDIGGVRTASDGSRAFQELRYFTADIVIVDWLMSPMDGMEFLRRIRNDDSPNPYVPIIMLTAYSDVERVKACRDAGVTEFRAKPFTPATLYGRLVSVVEDQRAYVRSDNYFGPDRRRLKRSFLWMDRRAGGSVVNIDSAQSLGRPLSA